MTETSTSGVAGLTRSSRLGITLLAVVLLLGVFAYCTIRHGSVRGEEFSPYSFQRRRFHYYEIPLVELQITPVQHMDTTGSVEDYLRNPSNDLLAFPPPAAGQPPERWDLVWARRGGGETAAGDAQILCNYLKALNAEDEKAWLAWSKQHPEAARLLWPIIAKLAEQELYFFVPDLFDIARLEETVATLRRRVHNKLGDLYREMADVQRALGRHDQAIELYSESLNYTPHNLAALRGRAEAYGETGDDGLAAEDRAEADRLEQTSP